MKTSTYVWYVYIYTIHIETHTNPLRREKECETCSDCTAWNSNCWINGFWILVVYSLDDINIIIFNWTPLFSILLFLFFCALPVKWSWKIWNKIALFASNHSTHGSSQQNIIEFSSIQCANWIGNERTKFYWYFFQKWSNVMKSFHFIELTLKFHWGIKSVFGENRVSPTIV